MNLGIPKDPSDTGVPAECKEFLLSDYTFIPSWDYSLAGLAGLWWDLTTSSIICARTLEHYVRALEPRLDQIVDHTGMTAERQEILKSEPESSQSGVAEPAVSQNRAPMSAQEKMISLINEIWPKERQEKLLDMVNRILRHSSPDEVEGFNWRKRRPWFLYHADTSVQSLEDSPQTYRLKQTHNVRLRPNIRKVIKVNFLPEADWKISTIHTSLPAEKLRHVSCIDYILCGTPKIPEIAISSVRGRASSRWDGTTQASGTESSMTIAKTLGRRQELWDLYFLGLRELNDMNLLRVLKPKDEQRELLAPSEDERKANDRKMFLDAYGKSLGRVLNDSVSVLHMPTEDRTVQWVNNYYWETTCVAGRSRNQVSHHVSIPF